MGGLFLELLGSFLYHVGLRFGVSPLPVLFELAAVLLLPMASGRPPEPGHHQLLDCGPALGVRRGRPGIGLFITSTDRLECFATSGGGDLNALPSGPISYPGGNWMSFDVLDAGGDRNGCISGRVATGALFCDDVDDALPAAWPLHTAGA